MWDCCGVWDNTPVEVWGDVLLAEISVYRYYLQFIHIYSACFRPLSLPILLALQAHLLCVLQTAPVAKTGDSGVPGMLNQNTVKK